MRKISLMIETTNRCNLKCTTCFSHQDGRGKTDMSLKSFIRIIRGNAGDISRISLYNYGEPLLNRSTSAMVHYAKKMGISYVKMATNGTLLTEEKSQALVRSGLDCISISVDGATQATYAQFRIGGNLAVVIRNIERLVAIRNEAGGGPEIEMQFIIMKHNEHEIPAIEALSRKLGVDRLRLKTVLIKKEQWDHLLPENDDYNRYASVGPIQTCRKPVDELVVNADGTVIPCCYVVGEDVKKYRLGNIMQQSLEEIRASSAYTGFVGNCLSNKDLNSCCKNCQEGNLKLDYKTVDLSRQPAASKL